MTSAGDWQRFGQSPPDWWRPEAAPPDGDTVSPSERPTVADTEPAVTSSPGEGVEASTVMERPGDAVEELWTPEPGGASQPSGASPLGEVIAAVAAVRDDLRRLTDVNEQQAALIDRLHTDNQALRRTETERQRDPLVRELIALADTSLRIARGWEKRDVAAAEPVADALRGVADDIRLILEHQGFEGYEPAPGDAFDRRHHRAKGSATTAEKGLDDHVAEVLRPGYRTGERTLRPAEVLVWRFDEAAAAPAATSVDGPASSYADFGSAGAHTLQTSGSDPADGTEAPPATDSDLHVDGTSTTT